MQSSEESWDGQSILGFTWWHHYNLRLFMRVRLKRKKLTKAAEVGMMWGHEPRMEAASIS